MFTGSRFRGVSGWGVWRFIARHSRSWCGRGDSNPHGLPHWNLNPARLPIPPRPHGQLRPIITDVCRQSSTKGPGGCRCGTWIRRGSFARRVGSWSQRIGRSGHGAGAACQGVDHGPQDRVPMGAQTRSHRPGQAPRHPRTEPVKETGEPREAAAVAAQEQ